jgi:signal transduction histidine kinase
MRKAGFKEIMFRDLSIRRKVLWILLLTSGIALFLAFFAFVINDIVTFRREEVRKMRILAGVIADNSKASLVFNDVKSARENLNALRLEGQILLAAIMKPEGQLFAIYRRDFDFVKPSSVPLKEGYRFKSGSLHLSKRILLDNSEIGTIYILSDMSELNQLLVRHIGIAFLILIIAGTTALFLSLKLQRVIADPIEKLTRVAKAVSQEKDYSMRVQASSKDELGTLTECWNEMLVQIQKRDEELEKARSELEARVEERTKELKAEIQERKVVEIQLRNKATELSRSNDDLRQFAYVASHDLQEPLRMVSNYTKLIEKKLKGKVSDETDEFMGYITNNVLRMYQLIQDLLAYSQVAMLQNPKELTSCDAILDRVLKHLEFSIKESRVSIIRSPLPTLKVDRVRLLQVFQNLIGNAIKFRNKTDAIIEIAAKKNAGEWIFSIRDNGIGIDPVYAERIFVIFQRLHSIADYPGTGIGLAICKKIIEQHGGRIWCESKLGEGSTFFFSIPE